MPVEVASQVGARAIESLWTRLRVRHRSVDHLAHAALYGAIVEVGRLLDPALAGGIDAMWKPADWERT